VFVRFHPVTERRSASIPIGDDYQSIQSVPSEVRTIIQLHSVSPTAHTKRFNLTGELLQSRCRLVRQKMLPLGHGR
jgi:hypothetical protein